MTRVRPNMTTCQPMIHFINHLIKNDCTAQKMKFFIKDFSSKCDQICRKLRIWSHLMKKSLMENFIFVGRCNVCFCNTFAGLTATFFISLIQLSRMKIKMAGIKTCLTSSSSYGKHRFFQITCPGRLTKRFYLTTRGGQVSWFPGIFPSDTSGRSHEGVSSAFFVRMLTRSSA